MPTRKKVIAPGEYYHILARGVNKQQLFFNERDFARFLFYILFFQSNRRIHNISYYIDGFMEDGDFGVGLKTRKEIIKEREVELVCFTLMENHIHLILKELEEGGISKMMQRALDGYARYIHTKYKKTGHIFEGPFKAVHIKNNNQLLYLSTYIHKNAKDIKRVGLLWEKYPWSSFQDFVKENRWGDLLAKSVILEQFVDPEEFIQFTRESSAKETKQSLDKELVIEDWEL